MRNNLAGAVWRLAIYLTVCLAATFALIAVFAQLRFQKEDVYRADFSNANGLEDGNFVRIAGVEVGKVRSVTLKPDATAVVEFSADPSVVLTEGTHAVVRWDNLIGGRYLELQEGAGGIRQLRPGQSIALDKTDSGVDLDALIGGFRPLFRALDPNQVNALTGQLVAAFQGQGTNIESFLAQTATVTNTLADHDQLIGEVITNLNTVLGSLGGQSKQFDKAVTSLSTLVEGLAHRKEAISDGVGHVNAVAGTIADLLDQSRPATQKAIHETDRTAAIVVADHEYFDDLLNTLPDAYQALGRQGIYGDFFSFYLCDAILKLNGKGGQPVYVKVAGQSSGRCTPK